MPLVVRGVLTAVFAATLLAGCSGCKKSSPEPEGARVSGPTAAWIAGQPPADPTGVSPRRGGTLTVRLFTEPPMLNRLHDAGQDAWMVRTMFGSVLETLCELDRETAPHYRLKPALAERWETSADGRTVTFHLRKGVKFHNGESFSARDVKAVLDAIADPKNPTARMRSYLTELERYETPDDHTVVLTWKFPYPLGTRQVATVIPIVPASALRGDFDALAINRAPIGTGPFRFEGWETGRALTLVRNDAYWARPAWLDRVVFRIVKDHTVATQMFERGDFDLMTFMLPSVWRELEKTNPANAWAWTGYDRIRFTENAYNWIGWNQARPIFKSREVRRALAHLLPLEQIARGVYLGLEPLTTCPFYSQGVYCDPALEAADSKERIPYDPKEGKRLLAAEGWRDTDDDGVLDKDGVPLRFTFLITANSVNLGKLAPILAEEFRRAGVQLDIERVDWALFTERLRKHEFDMVSLGWSTQDVEDDLYFNFHSSQVNGGTNYVSYVNPELDRLLEASRREADEAKRTALHRRIHRLIYDEQVYAFLGVRSSLDAVKTHVNGLRPAINWYRLADVWLEAPPATSAVAAPTP